MTSAAWRNIQALRATPTGLATTDPRRRTFAAALRQAEELALAADAVSYEAKPLPLFYSLSQAGRAIAAAHLPDRFELEGHGIQFRLGNSKKVLTGTLNEQGMAGGAFQDVATATGSTAIEKPTQLGALWAANPDLADVPIPPQLGGWPRAVGCGLGTRPPKSGNLPHITGSTILTILDLPGETGADIAGVVRNYPSLAGTRSLKFGSVGDSYAEPHEQVDRRDDGRILLGRPAPAERSMKLSDSWDLQDGLYSVVEIDQSASLYPDPNYVGWVIPEVAGGPAPSPLLLWWALLFGLSHLARYHPAAWTSAVDLDKSAEAAPLREVLDMAAEQVPVRVLAALRGR
ncbi:YaaC family protein [Actinoplanes sp. NPDC026623]|uniref:YaaC family protein n=1 Tax=Actinoplanes sp. NPDC026623 TaxID=3155610 RepID=UPI0034051653